MIDLNFINFITITNIAKFNKPGTVEKFFFQQKCCF